MFKCIFRRLFWTYFAITLIIFTIMISALSYTATRVVFSQQDKNIMSISESLEHITALYQIEETDFRARNAYKQSLIMWSHFLHGEIVVVNKDGEISESTGRTYIDKVPKDYLDTVISGKILRKRGDFGGIYEEKVLTIGVPVEYRGSIIGAMFFNSYLPKLYQNFRGVFFLLFFAALVSVIIAIILVYIQSKKISRPIGQINAAVRDIAAGNLSQRIPVTSNDEIGQLVSSFNLLADSVEKIEKQSAAFVSDVSHELRTPMTSITGFSQGLLDGTIPKEKQDYYLNIILEESKRLTKLVNDLLDMSKMSSNEYKLNISSFDINELIRVCIIGLVNKIEEKGLELTVDFKQDSLNVIADKDAITRVLINLLDNAVKFSYNNTTIGIETWVEKHKVHVCIGNFGEGIDSKDLSNVFKRFYKTDKSRTINNKSGAGLGLSFVKNILTLHKQSIWVESIDAKEGSNAKYTKFTFTLEAE